MGDFNMKDNIKLIICVIILVILGFTAIDISEYDTGKSKVKNNWIPAVAQNTTVDFQITEENITLSTNSVEPEEQVGISLTVSNFGTIPANFKVILYLEQNGTRTKYQEWTEAQLQAGNSTALDYTWTVPQTVKPGRYDLVITAVATDILITESNPNDNEATKEFIVNPTAGGSELNLETNRNYAYPGKKLKITVTFVNTENQQVFAKVRIYYYKLGDDISSSSLINELTITASANSEGAEELIWDIPASLEQNKTNYIIWSEVTEPLNVAYLQSNTTVKMMAQPDTSKTPVYTQIWFIVGLIALIIFFLTIIFSLIGYIPQDRLPIQPALVVMALVIMIIALVGNYLEPSVHLIGPQDIAGMVIIHPITALTAGFLVAGGLEASGAFAAAADGLGRIEKLKFRGRTIFGFTGTVVILTNVPTLIAMPCGRILGAALMPAALFFGYRVAKVMGDARMVGVVVFAFIVNAAASCGPSPLGGIGTIGEGLSKMPIGSFTTAQSTGIMICTGVCALFMRYVTFMRPADLSDEDIKREIEAERQGAITDKDQQDVKYDPAKNGGVGPKPEPANAGKAA